MEESDAQLQLKKRARRRLVGAVAFVSFVALVLPMVMDQEPRQPVQDVEIRIPGQDEKPFAPKFSAGPAEHAPAPARAADVPAAVAVELDKPRTADKPSAQVVERIDKAAAEKASEKASEKVGEKSSEKAPEKPAAKPEKSAEKPAEKTTEKPADKAAEKKPAAKDNADAKRAAALLGGGHAEAAAAPAAPAKSGEYLVLIGAFANEANVKNLKNKLGEQGIKTFTEPLDTPQGRKIRLRAGPFASREAAEKAQEKMQRIGVSGVVSGK